MPVGVVGRTLVAKDPIRRSSPFFPRRLLFHPFPPLQRPPPPLFLHSIVFSFFTTSSRPTTAASPKFHRHHPRTRRAHDGGHTPPPHILLHRIQLDGHDGPSMQRKGLPRAARASTPPALRWTGGKKKRGRGGARARRRRGRASSCPVSSFESERGGPVEGTTGIAPRRSLGRAIRHRGREGFRERRRTMGGGGTAAA